ncbi:DoxX family protein [Flavobacterium sp. FlaQc-57]|uniref:DoxX family protein n=1 Tax=Flavobacterium sp. FlaQc-57 TaxID=3374186 RepID=UPI0037576654
MAKVFTSNGTWNNGVFIIRIAVAFYIFKHSLELFDIQILIKFLTEINFPFPVFSAYTAKIIEFVGAILLAVGLFTKFITPLLITVMVGVIYTMSGGDIFNGELPFLFALHFALFFFIGPGKWSLDYLLFDK